MGRLATYVAASATHADNLEPVERLPAVSVIDALLPRRLASIGSLKQRPLDSRSNIAPSITHTDIKKDGSGKMVMVRHKSQPGSLMNGGGEEDATAKGKQHNNGGKKNGKNDNAKDKAAEVDGEGGKPWTAGDDGKLKELKAANTTWNNIATELGRTKQEVIDRFKEIKDEPTGAADGKKGDAAPAAKAGGGDAGDFTAEEDAKIKELLANNIGFKKIDQELGRPNNAVLKDHMNKLKEEVGTGGGNAAPAGDKKQDNSGKKQDKAGKGGTGGNDFTAADDAKIKELADAGKPYHEIAKALGKKMGNEFKEHVEEVRKQGGGGGKDAAAADKQQNEGGGKKNKKKDTSAGGGGGADQKAEKERPPMEKKDHKPSSKAGSVVSRRSHRSEAKFTMREWMTLQEDDLLSFSELQLLTELINKNPGRSWLSVASAFHDKTGRRVHPDDIRDKFDEMGRMG